MGRSRFPQFTLSLELCAELHLVSRAPIQSPNVAQKLVV